jgi:hypothetical protein
MLTYMLGWSMVETSPAQPQSANSPMIAAAARVM